MLAPRFEIVEELLRSPRWVLSRARDRRDGSTVLVKLAPEGSDSTSDLEREWQLLRSIAADGFPRALELVTESPGSCLVLEDRGLEPLPRILAVGALRVENALRISLAVCRALAELHRGGRIHGCPSPSSLLVDPHGNDVEIVDLSIVSRLPPEVPALAAALVASHGVAFMAPEATGRINRAVDHRTDLYVVGATLYALLTGRSPFVSEDTLELMHAHIARTPLSPDIVVPGIPEPVSAIVMRLLAKSADDRYQSAEGLAYDIERCLREWHERGTVSPFRLGERDGVARLSLPAHLYGRDDARAVIARAARGALDAGPRLLLVGGYSGVGKTALVNEQCRPLVGEGGYFVTGKFDLVARSQPYGGLLQALRSLVRQVLAKDDERVAGWRVAIESALGTNGGVVAAVVPDIEFILGAQPEPPPLDAAESQLRFRLALEALLTTFARPGHPLVLFLDDLQWADPATLTFLHGLLTGSHSSPLFIVGAFRDNDLTAGHPLHEALQRLDSAGASIDRLTLGSLDHATLRALLADTLAIAPGEAETLAGLVHVRTAGNPFFVIQFLEKLYRDGFLIFDTTHRRWTYSLAEIAAAKATDDVAVLVAERIGRLSTTAQAVLQVSACLGATFSGRTLEAVGGLDPAAVRTALSEALAAGLLQPHQGSAPERSASDVEGRYGFLHDRVQQAAYDLIPPEARPGVHLDIGRRLRDTWPGDVPDERVFEVVDHLNAGAHALPFGHERLSIARLNLAAGRAAKLSGAYGAALDYLRAGVSQAGDAGWTADPSTTFAIHFELAECLYLSGRFDPAEAMHAVLLTHARTSREQASVHELRITFYEGQTRYLEAIASCRAGLALFGLSLPESAGAVAEGLLHERRAIDARVRDRTIGSLVTLPVMEDEDIRSAMRLLTLVWAPVYLSGDQPLTSLISATMVRLSLAHGNTEDSAYGYVTHAMTVGPILKDYQAAFEWGELAIAVNERFGDLRRRAKIHQQIHAHVRLWRQPFDTCIPLAREARRCGYENGDMAYAGYGAATESWPALVVNRSLDGFVREFSPSLDFLVKVNMHGFRDAQAVLLTWALALQGRTPDRLTLSSDLVDEKTFIERHEGTAPLFMAIFRWAKLHLCVMFDEVEAGLEAARLARATEIAGTMWPVLSAFWSAVAFTAAWERTAEQVRPSRLAKLIDIERSLEELALSCPENFRGFHLLTCAERGRVEGRVADACSAYREAIAYAGVTNNVQQLALAHELCGRAYDAAGDRPTADRCFAEAYSAYASWGATAKLRHMERRYGVNRLGVQVPTAPVRSAPPIAFAERRATVNIDIDSVLRGARAITREVETESLLQTLMTLALESAGAARGIFFEAREDGLTPLVSAHAHSDRVEVARGGTWDEVGPLAGSAARYVHRTHEDMVVGNVADDERLGPLAASTAARSVLCLPVAWQGRTAGVLFLENALADTFTPDRIEVVRALAAQTAISLENARLYEDMKGEIRLRRRTEQALRDALAEVEALKNRLEAENVYLQEEIRTQHNFTEIVGQAPALVQALTMIERVAPTDSTVLILGETGTGKELFARAVHDRSRRASRPLVKVNCGAVPLGLIESELFGHVKGAFTGALDKRIGRFELAHGGTIFLDEVGELPLDAQVKLLRVIQEHEFEPVGSSRSMKVDVRVIAATNRRLEDEIAAGRFRADLYYRLNVLPVTVPPLRDRRGDIPALVAFFVQRCAKRIGRRVVSTTPESLALLCGYLWPGNVRELENVIERALVISTRDELVIEPHLLTSGPAVLPDGATGVSSGEVPPPAPAAYLPSSTKSVVHSGTLEEVERQHIIAILVSTSGIIDGPRGAARLLGLHPNTLRSRMKRLGVSR